jgi:hypothetical protein
LEHAPPVRQQVIEIRLRHGRVVRSTNLCDTAFAWLGGEFVLGKNENGVDVALKPEAREVLENERAAT